jgi:hypothetical protein
MIKKEKTKWGNNKCSFCGKLGEKYAGNGLCRSCYQKLRYKTNEEVREYYKNKTYEWIDKNHKRWREINNKAVNKFNNKNKKG